MNELADRIVALGILHQMGQSHELYWLSERKCVGYASDVEKSWEVAGALMEKCVAFGLKVEIANASDGENIDSGCWVYRFDANTEYVEPSECWQEIAHAKSESPSHVISLACVEALEAA